MACTISAAEIKRVKALGFLNNKGTDLFNARVITVNGKITAHQTAVLAQAAEKFGSGEVEFTTRLTVEIRGVPFQDIPAFQEFIAQAGLMTGGTGSLVRPVVSCKGTTCQYGLYDTFDLSEKIHKRFYLGYHQVKLPHKFKIACGGCPNNCVKPTLNDLGIIGQMVPQFGSDSCNDCKKCRVEDNCPMHAARRDEAEIAIDPNLCNNCGRCIGMCPLTQSKTACPVSVFISAAGGEKGGPWTASWKKSSPMSRSYWMWWKRRFSFFREQGRTGERFADTIERLGFAQVERELLEGNILDRKQEILDAQLHLTGGATC